MWHIQWVSVFFLMLNLYEKTLWFQLTLGCWITGLVTSVVDGLLVLSTNTLVVAMIFSVHTFLFYRYFFEWVMNSLRLKWKGVLVWFFLSLLLFMIHSVFVLCACCIWVTLCDPPNYHIYKFRWCLNGKRCHLLLIKTHYDKIILLSSGNHTKNFIYNTLGCFVWCNVYCGRVCYELCNWI